jgi:hypothetical protein
MQWHKDQQENGYQATHRQKSISKEEDKVGVSLNAPSSMLGFQKSQAIENNHQTSTHVGKYCHPHGCIAKNRQSSNPPWSDIANLPSARP